MSFPSPLLNTKLHFPPTRASFVHRPRLTARLRESLTKPLTVIAAPPGFGKTSLVSEWSAELRTAVLDAQPPRLAWLSLDVGDNDLARFWVYVIAALQTIQPALGAGALNLLQSPQPPLDATLTSLLNDLANTPQPLALILDDYHLIEAPALHEALTFLIERLPTHVHLITLTRTDPPLPLARWRARGQLVELRADDLRFTLEEATAFLNEGMGLHLSPEAVAALETRTEGWITGLQLAALSLQEREDPADFVAAFSGSHRHVIDYLMEEVLSRQPVAIQSFLLHTSILERLCGPLCEALTGQANGQRTLEQLERGNLFLIPLDDKREWYRYHHLFAEGLRTRMQQAEPDHVRELHRRAGAWLSANGWEVEGIQHALAGGDFFRAADRIEHIGRWMMTGAVPIPLIHTWLSALPEALMRTRPRLCLLDGWRLVWDAQFEAAEKRLQIVEQTAQLQSSEADHRLAGEVAAIRTNIRYATGDIAGTQHFAVMALEQLPADEHFLNSMMALMLGHAHRLGGDPQAALRAYSHVFDLPAQQLYVPGALIAMGHCIQLEMALGKLLAADQAYQRVMGFVRAGRLEELPPTGVAHVEMAAVLYERNDLAGAAREAERGLALCRLLPALFESGIDACLTLAQVHAAQASDDRAFELLQQAIHLGRTHSLPHWVARAEAYQARLWLSLGQHSAAADWVQARNLPTDHTPSHMREAELLTYARFLTAQNATGAAVELLMQLLSLAHEQRRRRSELEIRAVLALAYFSQHELEAALTALAPALQLAETHGFVRSLLSEGGAMVPLLQHAASRGLHPATVTKLLGVIQPMPARTGSGPRLPQPLVEPLSERELEVLRLIAKGRTNQEIAAAFVIALSTVKKHINNIYGKLHVRTRTQAVARARDLNLL